MSEQKEQPSDENEAVAAADDQPADEASEAQAADTEVATTGDEASEDEELPDWAVRQLEAVEGPADEATQASPDAEGTELQENAGAAAAGVDAGGVTDSLATLDPDIAEHAKQSAPNLELMLDLPLDVTVELGRADLPLAQVLGLKAGSVIQLDRLPGEPFDLLVNGQLVARGEIVVLNDTFAFRITDLIDS